MSDFNKFYNLLAPHILSVNYQVETFKEAVLYQLFADKLMVFVCGHPASGAKSMMRKSLEKICPSFDYVFLKGWQTSKGLAETILRVREGLVMLDELNKASAADRTMLYDICQFQTLKIDKFGVHKLIPCRVNILGLGNPKPRGSWYKYGNVDIMREQIPLDMALMRRFHVNIFLRDYTPEEFDKINRFKENVKNPIISMKDAEWFQNQIIEKRQLEPKGRVPNRVFEFLKRLKIFENDIITPVTPELFEGIYQIAKARARIRNSEKITMRDWNGTLKFYIKVLRTSGLTNRLIEKKLVKGK